tara:strand:- start:979 stop:1227 length:249 start_codon:yes stop_codon:yes gene_type:complete
MKTQEEITAAYKALYHTATWTNGETFVATYNKMFPNSQVRELGGYVGDQFNMMQRNPLEFALKWPDLTAALIDKYLNPDLYN